jgi:hypothetical protein
MIPPPDQPSPPRGAWTLSIPGAAVGVEVGVGVVTLLSFGLALGRHESALVRLMPVAIANGRMATLPSLTA